MRSSWERLIEGLVRSRILKSDHVIRAMKMVPRHIFLSQGDRSYASIDAPLPIGGGQTVSAPLG